MAKITSDRIEISVMRLPRHEGLDLPMYRSEGSSGMDLQAAVTEDISLLPGERALVPTGIAISLPPGFEAQVRPRSGLAIEYGVGLINSPGTIDSDYRGEIQVVMINWGQEPFTIRRGMRIAQLVVCQYAMVRFKVVEELDVTIRNKGGFGHSGV